MTPFFSERFGNPSSSYPLGRLSKTALESARTEVAAAIGARPSEIIFTSGGTESNHLAIFGTVLGRKAGHLLISAVEHPSVIEPCLLLKNLGYDVTLVGVDGTGRVRLDEFIRSIRPDTILVSVMHANNEVGTVQPVEEMAGLARDRGIPFHTDAAQSMGKIPVHVDAVGADLLTIVGHKIYGPKGIGALYVREGTLLDPIFRGGGQEQGLRAGTENVPLAVGLGTACRLAVEEDWGGQSRNAAEHLWAALATAVTGIRRNGNPDQRLPNTVHVTIPGVTSRELLSLLEHDVAASAGSACHSGGDSPSAVLHAMGFSLEDARSSVRFSTGKDTSEELAAKAAARVVAAVADRRSGG